MEKKLAKILCEDLTSLEKAVLLQTTLTPGFQTVIKMANAAVLRATQDIAKLDPEMPEYERLAIERARRARNINEFSELLFSSIYAHADSIKRVERAEDEKAEESVDKIFGIHPAVAGADNNVVKKVFGIHPAKPPKPLPKEPVPQK